MGKGYLIDTNAAIDYMGEKLPVESLDFLDNVFNHQFYLSVVNKIELLGFKGITEKERGYFTKLVDHAILIPLDDAVIEKTIELRKGYSIKIPDAIIAAAAVTSNLALVSRNVKDFQKIEGLSIVDPYHLAIT